MVAHVHRFLRAFVSVNRIRSRRSSFKANKWIMDSGAFTEVSTHGGYRHDVKEYAEQVRRWFGNGEMECAVSQDWMCEPHIINRTGLSVAEHQRLTVERYDALNDFGLPVHIMPVIQGYYPDDYRRHVDLYGDRLGEGMWTGVGSICKRNSAPSSVLKVLWAVKKSRPDLRLHGFGLKMTALANFHIQAALYSADSMAWSFAARKEGRDQNSWKEADAFREKILALNPLASLSPIEAAIHRLH